MSHLHDTFLGSANEVSETSTVEATGIRIFPGMQAQYMTAGIDAAPENRVSSDHTADQTLDNGIKPII